MAKNFRTDKFFWGATAKKLKFWPIKNQGFLAYFQFFKFFLKVWHRGVKIIFVVHVSRNLASPRSSKLDLTSPHYDHYKKGKILAKSRKLGTPYLGGVRLWRQNSFIFSNKCHIYFKIFGVSKKFETLFFYVPIELDC